MFWKAPQGLGIARVVPNGPASRAGLKGIEVVREVRTFQGQLVQFERLDRETADRIVAINGDPVSTTDDLQQALDKYKPGTTVDATVLRRNRQFNVQIVLGEER